MIQQKIRIPRDLKRSSELRTRSKPRDCNPGAFNEGARSRHFMTSASFSVSGALAPVAESATHGYTRRDREP